MTTNTPYHTRDANAVSLLAPARQRDSNNGGWRIPCPAHKGEDFNCAIWDDKDGVGFKCWSHECSVEDIKKALGIWQEPSARFERCVICGKGSEDTRMATYRHKSGVPVCVHRIDCIRGLTCKYPACKPTDTKHNWDGIKRKRRGCSLFFWGDDSPDDVLVIVEGEKSAAALQSYGLSGYTPVSYIGGTGSVQYAVYDSVTGRKVIVWPDNDGIGVKAGETVAQKSLEAGAAIVEMVDVADSRLNFKGADCADVSAQVAMELLTSAVEVKAPKRSTPANRPEPFDELKQYTQLNAADYAKMFLPRLADRTLISTHRDMSGRDISEVWLCNSSGIWRRPEDELKAEVRKLIDERIIAVTDDGSMSERAKVQEFKYINRAKSEQIQSIIDNFPSVRFTLEEEAPDTIKGLTIRSGDELDDNTRCLGAPNGVIDLHTGELLTGAHARRTLTTRMVPYPYDPDATHEDVDKLFSHLAPQEKDWLLSALGFGLKGNPMRRMYFLRGDGGQGKGTVLTAIAACLGPEYCESIPEGALSRKRAASAGLAPELLFAHHARIAIQSELDRGNLNERIIKAISGGGRGISGRSPHSRSFDDRRSVCTMLISTNPRPNLNFNDRAMYDRVRILPYPMPPEIDEELEERLQRRAQAQALLTLLVKYAVNTTTPPKDVSSVRQEREDTKLESMGEVGHWLRDAILPDYNGRLWTTELWAAALVASGGSPDDKEAWGKTRDGIRDLVKDIHGDLPALKRGNKGFYWLGYRLATAEEMAGTATAPEMSEGLQLKRDMESRGIKTLLFELTNKRGEVYQNAIAASVFKGMPQICGICEREGFDRIDISFGGECIPSCEFWAGENTYHKEREVINEYQSDI